MSVKSWAVVVTGIVVTTAALGGFKYLQISSAIAEAMAMPEPMETVAAATVRAGTWSASSRAVGTVVATRQVVLRNELAGTVTEIAFESGSIVEAGQILLKLDTRAEEADLAAARADAELARLTLERRQKLVTTNAGTAAELDQARAALAAARAQVEANQVRIDKKTIRAPFKARVGIRDLQPGAYLSEGTTITTLQGVDADAYVDFSFPQDEAAAVAIGTSVRLSGRLPGGQSAEVEAKVLAREAAVDDATRSVKFRAVAKGLGDVLQPGAFVDVHATVAAPRPALYIPVTAVRRAPYGDQVFTLVQDGDKLRAKQRFVKVGPVQGEDMVVLEGLQEGERIATKGSFKLREGLAVMIEAPQTAQAGAPAAPQPKN